MSDVFLSDNTGHRVPPTPESADPVLATGQTLTNGTPGVDTSVTVVAGARYAITAQIAGGFLLGVAAVTTPANIVWLVPLGKTAIIVVPSGITTLHYMTDTANALGYLRRIG